MEDFVLEKPNNCPPTININSILIDGINYSYSITCSSKKQGILLKLTEINPDKNVYFLYEASKEEIIKQIKPLFLCGNIEEMIKILRELFEGEKVKVIKKDEKYIMEFQFKGIGIDVISQIELEKHDQSAEANKFSEELKEINEKYNKLKKEISELKNEKNI